MTIDLCIPYGTLKEESKFLMLFGAYLKHQAVPVQQVVCDGVMETCYRDRFLSFRRSVQSCLECTFEQERLAGWGDLPRLRLSQYADGAATTQVIRSLVLTTDEDVKQFVSLDGKPYWPLVESLFLARFESEYDHRNKLHVSFARRCLSSAANVDILLRAHFQASKPTQSEHLGAVLSFGLDFFSQLFALRAHEVGRPVVKVSWDEESNRCRISHPITGEICSPEIHVSEIVQCGPNLGAWPSEVLDEFARLGDILGLMPLEFASAANA